MKLRTSARGRDRSATEERSGLLIAHALSKVPEIGAMFWVLKLLTTGMGEAMSDFLGQQSVSLVASLHERAARSRGAHSARAHYEP